MEWKPSSVASHRLLPLLTLLAIFLVFLVTFLCSVFFLFSGQHFFVSSKNDHFDHNCTKTWFHPEIAKSPNVHLIKLCTACSELFLAWFHCEIRAGLQVATARSTAVSPNLLLL